jgi:hypothetical protein
MNIFKAVGSLFGLVSRTVSQAGKEREQMGPEGRAYSDALKASGDAYYKKHGTYEGWAFDDGKTKVTVTTMKGNE